MSLTRLQFRTSLRYVIADQSIWKDTQINSWINDAIRDYSASFPRQATYTITTTANVREYSLSDAGVFGTTTVIAVVRVEYPVSQEPPVYLSRLQEHSPNFYGGAYYDVIGDPPATLVIGETPGDTESIYVTCSVIHTIPSGDSSALTVPDHHLELLRSFVIWKASQYLEDYAAIDPGRKAAMINAIGKTAAQAEKYYYWAIERAVRHSARSGATGPWRMDKKDQIY